MTHWNSHSRDIIENFKRFYVNQMLDADKQLAINVFLGITDDRAITGKELKFGGYDQWYDPKKIGLPPNNKGVSSSGSSGASNAAGEKVLETGPSSSTLVAKEVSVGESESRFDLEACERALESFAADGITEGETGVGPGTGWNGGTNAEFWVEYYRPLLFTGLGKHFSYGMNSTLKLPG